MENLDAHVVEHSQFKSEIMSITVNKQIMNEVNTIPIGNYRPFQNKTMNKKSAYKQKIHAQTKSQ